MTCTTEVKCPVCDGSGHIACQLCNGIGCFSCHLGYFECQKCNGSKIVKIDVTCTNCENS